MRYYVYMVRCSDGTLYTGITTDLVRRTREHNSGRGARYTSSRLPVALVYSERARNRSDALAREFQVKRLSRSAKLLLCRAYSVGRVHSLR